MRFVRGQPKPANGGRKKGVRNKRTVAAASKAAHPDALDHLAAVMAAKDDPTITPELKLRAAIGLAAYQHPKPVPLRAAGKRIDLEPPKSAQEAQDAIAKVTSMIARCEIDGEHGSRVIAGLKEYRDGRAAELEALYEKDKMSGGEP
jgi:hypothetical protein